MIRAFRAFTVGMATATLLFAGACGDDENAGAGAAGAGNTGSGLGGFGGSGAAGGQGGQAGCPGCVGAVTQWGITWTFDSPHPVGQYANGDYWVLGPVVVTAITPDFDGEHNGWEVNPVVEGPQGFEIGAGEFDPTLVPALPYTAAPGSSIVKTVSLDPSSSEPCYPGCVKTAAVLTVVGEVPPDGGASLFRPPYVGAEKPLYPVASLRTDLLAPGYAATASAPSAADIEARFQMVQVNHKTGAMGRVIRPTDNYQSEDPYGADLGQDDAMGALWLLLDTPLADKEQALVYYVQMGIDWYHAVLLGQTWPAGGGYSPGMKLPLAFAAVMLDDPGMTSVVETTDFLSDTEMIYEGEGGVALFGSHVYYGDPDFKYWDYHANSPGWNAEYADPYGYVDASNKDGAPPNDYEVCCLSQPWKGEALAARLLPDMQAIWNDDPFFGFVDRWVSTGTWTQPDPCAPADGLCAGGDQDGAPCTTASAPTACTGGGVCDLKVYWDPDGTLGLENHYGVTYGPDGNGGCILDTDPSDGTGRFPLAHATEADSGYYGSTFVNEMWTAYR